MKRRLFVIASTLAVATALIVACGDDDAAPPLDGSTDAQQADRSTSSDANAIPTTIVAPTISGPSYPEGSCVNITAPAGEIHYTRDGTTPTSSSPVYQAAFAVETPGTTTVKAIAVTAGGSSEVASMAFTVDGLPVVIEAPTFSPTSTTRDAGFTLQLSINGTNSVVCYTVDGGVPACTGHPRGLICAGDAGPSPPATCTAGTTYGDAGVRLAGDSGTSITVIATGCKQGGQQSAILKQNYSFE